MKLIQNSILIGLITFLFSSNSYSQIDQNIETKDFHKVVVSPFIDVELVKGEKETVHISAQNLDPKKLNVKVKGKTLRIFLDHARIATRTEKVVDPSEPNSLYHRSPYENVRVKATITYVELKHVQLRGEGHLTCNDRLGSNKLKIKLYGDVDVHIASIDAHRFKLTSFGDNEISIKSGAVDFQLYKMFGENTVRTSGVNSTETKVRVFGEGDLTIATKDHLKVSCFGESNIYLKGNPVVTKSLILGEFDLYAY
ncbi:MAG: DUF2807 domain-containing protein [Cyclobacteriaceae bacterium]